VHIVFLLQVVVFFIPQYTNVIFFSMYVVSIEQQILRYNSNISTVRESLKSGKEGEGQISASIEASRASEILQDNTNALA